MPLLQPLRRHSTGQYAESSNQRMASPLCGIPEDPRPGGASDFLSGASNFVMNNPFMVNISRVTDGFNTRRTVLDFLAEYRVPGAELDSEARYPPPCCHPGTRQDITQKIHVWLKNQHRQWQMFWLYGFAGVGKSAVAQTIAESCDRDGRLGATFFFSRPNHRDNPNYLIPTLAYQLAVRIPSYKDLISKQLVDDPRIFEKSFQAQFRKLIIDPFSMMKTQSRQPREPWLIILDGLDECKSEHAQCDIVELLGDLVRSSNGLPLLWMICSRPEHHLKTTFARVDFEILCWREELSIDSAESRQDVSLFLRSGFRAIRQKYPEHIKTRPGEAWPPLGKFNQIVTAASGLFIFATLALKFVGDPEHADPESRLEAFVGFLKNARDVGADPFNALDLLYARILSDIPAPVRSTTMLLVTFLALHPCRHIDSDKHPLPIQVLSNLFGLSQGTFYSAMRKLHSILYIPPPEDGIHQSIRFLHASFGDYLLSKQRSGEYCALERREEHLSTFVACLPWATTLLRGGLEQQDANLSTSSSWFATLAARLSTWGCPTKPDSSVTPIIQWPADNDEDAALLIERIKQTALYGILMSTYYVDKTNEQVILGLRNFNFAGLSSVEVTSTPRLSLLVFELGLSDAQQVLRKCLPNIWRTESICEADFWLLRDNRALLRGVAPFVEFLVDSWGWGDR